MDLTDASPDAVPIWFATENNWTSLKESLAPAARGFAESVAFTAAAGRTLWCPGEKGGLSAVVMGVEPAERLGRDPLQPGALASTLPAKTYAFANSPPGGDRELRLAVLSWLLSTYEFTRYKPRERSAPRLVSPPAMDGVRIAALAEAIALGRDLVNTPANDMGPEALEEAAMALAKRHGARAKVIRGDRLGKAGFPLIHAVGRAAEQEPRLVDFGWGAPNAPKVTLVGKGVCFDTGGLDLKPASAMGLMKKDMAGAATALTLAKMIMDAKLGVRLRVLLPIVENAIAANAFRPGDVYPSRKGLHVEIGNTDAEGRLILADALAFAEEEQPDLLFNFATLTGAARVALGPDLPPFYTHDEGLAADISAHATAAADPVWRLPLWAPYDAQLASKVAALNNVSPSPFAGSIIAALFLARFVDPARSWAHFDVYGWNPSTRPGRPEGGEIQTARLLFDLVAGRLAAGTLRKV